MPESRPEPPSTSALAPASVVLAIALVAVFCAQLALGGTGRLALARMGAQYPLARADGAWWTVASATLLHLGWAHVLLNAAFVAAVGSRIERTVGPARMLVVFFAGGLAGSSLSELLLPDVVSAGASGGAWGLMLAELLLVAVPALRRGAPPRATLAASAQLVLLNAVISVVPGINGLAHLGGGIGGALALAASHLGGRAWAPIAALLAAGHLGALGFAVARGRPWTLADGLAAAERRVVLDGYASALVPGNLALAPNGTSAGDPERDPVALEFGLDPQDAGEEWLATWRDGRHARDLPCVPGCTAFRVDGEPIAVVAWAQRVGPVALLGLAVVDEEAPAADLAWVVDSVGTLAWTERGGELLAELAADRLDDAEVAPALVLAEAAVAAAPRSPLAAEVLAAARAAAR